MALRNLLVRVGADISGLQKGMNKAQSQLNGFSKSVKGIKGKIVGALASIGAGLYIKGGIEDAMKFEALMGTLGESLGSSMKDFVKWQNTVGASLGYSKLQSAELANTLSLNFKQIATSQKDLMDKTTKMMETAAVIANKRGMAMSEVSDRIRSAMNQEADGADELGVNVRVSAIQQSKAYKEMANGTPWSDLSTNMQKAILYHHILQSVSTNLGDTLQNNTAMKMSAFTASLADTRLALGQAFLPILSTVLPVLTAFMRKIEVAFQYVSAFTRALFGYSPSSKASTKATEQQTGAVTGLGNAIKKTGKEAAKAAKANRGVAGFDEINQLADPASSNGSGGGSSGGSGGGGGNDNGKKEEKDTGGYLDKISAKVKAFVKKFKKFFEPMKKPWEELKKSLGMVWDSIKDLWNSKFTQALVKWLSGGWDVGIAGVMKMVSGAFKILAGAINIVTAIVNGDFKKSWEGLKKIWMGIYDILVGVIEPIFPGFEKMMSDFGNNFMKVWDSILNINWSDIAAKMKKKTGEIWTSIKSSFNDPNGWFRQSVVGQFVTALENHKEPLKKKAAEIWAGIKYMFKDPKGWFKDNVSSKISAAMAEKKAEIAKKAGEIWSAIKEKFAPAYTWFKDNISDPIKKSFSNIKNAFSISYKDGFKTMYNEAVGWINKMIRGLNKMIGKLNGLPIISGIPTVPEIPKLAKGGITNGPMMAMIGDNPGGREVVSPLSDLQGMIGTAVMSAMKFNQGGGNNTGGDIIFNLDGRQFARIVKPHLDKESKRIGTNVKLQGI